MCPHCNQSCNIGWGCEFGIMTIVTATDNKPYAGRMLAVSMKTRNAELLILHPGASVRWMPPSAIGRFLLQFSREIILRHSAVPAGAVNTTTTVTHYRTRELPLHKILSKMAVNFLSLFVAASFRMRSTFVSANLSISQVSSANHAIWTAFFPPHPSPLFATLSQSV